eukprot:scaffold20524_cov85-Skeletonema_dohrnii-CCMP3373.AAC.8
MTSFQPATNDGQDPVQTHMHMPELSVHEARTTALVVQLRIVTRAKRLNFIILIIDWMDTGSSLCGLANYGLPVRSYTVTNTISRDLTNGLEPTGSTEESEGDELRGGFHLTRADISQLTYSSGGYRNNEEIRK